MKVEFPADKRLWHPSLIPGAVVLIGTYGAKNEPNVAPKSWIQMASMVPPVLMFSGTEHGATEQNLLEKGCFTVNFVNSALADETFACIGWRGRERIEKLGVTLVPAPRVFAPLVEQCPAHLECRLTGTKAVGSALIVFGEIVGALISDEIIAADGLRRYELLDQIVYLEDGVYARMNAKAVRSGLIDRSRV